ncbi:L domain-like protein [Suhomyces tanzawaensis NRRL Y-17324]|uniref:L domain-like protein n=1 Tax=Suhomyces tanzawaensis NRRL Y-17324 TaxID=984487 RepID=A0A1E4SPP9_9ASCO|nr:L domain-like protein [Suhomyces tanzawaensis NRRL Y-17324]ODV81499.1 L domain-like protein [Suhomyces tanzawaensis NRRL Y-17324]
MPKPSDPSDSLPDFQELSKLPDEVLTTIFELLPPEYVQEFLLFLPATRSFVESEYFSEVHFIVSPTRRPYVTSLTQLKLQYCAFKSFFDITQFLDCNEDFIPKKLLLVSGGDFQSLTTLLRFYRKWITRVPILDFTIDTHSLTTDDFSLLLSFPNLKRIHFSGVEMDWTTKFLRKLPEFRSHPGLENVIFLGHGIYSWKDIDFPPNVRHLDLSWTKTDVLSINLSDKISELYLNNAGVSLENLSSIRFPPNLKTLMMTYNKLETFNLDVLPESLETIDLSFNGIQWFEGSKWPAGLKSIFLASNHLGDDEMKQLTLVPWPQNLERLSVEANIFTDLRNLGNLPSLNWLDVGMCEIRGFEGFEFPSSLRYLRMGSCERIAWPTGPPGQSQQPDPTSNYPDRNRMVFPPSLLELDLMSCKIPSLHYFSFPKSLTKLALSGNRITSLALYEDEKHRWSILENLVELDLFKNRITSLDHWRPPASLKSLDLSDNKLTKISGLPLFDVSYNSHTTKLHTINVSENSITDINGIHLPENLARLKLRDNLLETVSISPSIANHQVLRELDLSQNRIRSLQFTGKGTGKIQEVDLSGNLLLKGGEGGALGVREKMGQFYDDFEAGFGVRVSARKFNVNSVHRVVSS